MPDTTAPFDPRTAWLAHLARIGGDHGFFERVGPRHLGLFVQEGDTLVVSFDQAERLWAGQSDGMPLGFDLVTRRQWSLLSLIGIGQTWFRGPDLRSFFARLAHDGFFSGFSRVLFLGIGPAAGFAACAYSAACPEATVLASRPVASLRPSAVPFERRFRAARRLDFSGRQGFAPAMLRTASRVVLLYDPVETLGAAHAALYRLPNVVQVALPHSCPDLDGLLMRSGVLVPLARMTTGSKVTPARLRDVLRPVLRGSPDYLARLTRHAEETGHPARAALIARAAAAGSTAPQDTAD